MWLLQKNIWGEYGYDCFVQSLQDHGVEFEMVNLVPFTTEFEPDISFEPQHVFGSNRFVNVCRERGYSVFESFEPFEKFYDSEHWLNGEQGQDVRWGELINAEEIKFPLFVKPYTEKFFTGTIINSYSDFDKVQLATSFIKDEMREMVRVSPAVNIYDEVRFFIINRRIVSGSYYVMGKQKKQAMITADHEAWKTCERILAGKYIDVAFVMDLGAIADNQWKIVELNNINSAGFYKNDTNAIVSALKNL